MSQPSHNKAERFLDFLREEGYVPRLDDDGDVLFKYEGRGYALYGDEHDPALVRLVHPYLWKIHSEEEQELAQEVVNDLNTRLHVVKFYLTRGHVWAAVELLIDPLDHFPRVLPRAMRLLAAAVKKFVAKMRPDEEWTV